MHLGNYHRALAALWSLDCLTHFGTYLLHTSSLLVHLHCSNASYTAEATLSTEVNDFTSFIDLYFISALCKPLASLVTWWLISLVTTTTWLLTMQELTSKLSSIASLLLGDWQRELDSCCYHLQASGTSSLTVQLWSLTWAKLSPLAFALLNLLHYYLKYFDHNLPCFAALDCTATRQTTLGTPSLTMLRSYTECFYCTTVDCFIYFEYFKHYHNLHRTRVLLVRQLDDLSALGAHPAFLNTLTYSVNGYCNTVQYFWDVHFALTGLGQSLVWICRTLHRLGEWNLSPAKKRLVALSILLCIALAFRLDCNCINHLQLELSFTGLKLDQGTLWTTWNGLCTSSLVVTSMHQLAALRRLHLHFVH